METLTEDGVVHIAQRAAIERMAEDILYPEILCGHTHVPRALRLSDGRLLVNPRSVGCPAYADDQPVAHKVEAGSPHARYAVVERTSGDWNVTFRCVAYDHMAASLLAAERNRPEWARALATGFVD